MKDKIPYKIIFESVVGSQSYGLATPQSDEDIKGVYIQSDEDILANKYVPQIEVNKDTVYYELRRFLELVSTANPNVLELLYAPEKCIRIAEPEWIILLHHRELFLTKQAYFTYSGYAKTQLAKASGLNKKFNWEKKRTEKKNIADFCKVLDRDSGKTSTLNEWIPSNNLRDDNVGLTSINGIRDGYKLYVGDYYKGWGNDNTNEPKKSIVAKEDTNLWMGFMYFNRESYSTHCKEYSEYQKWLKNRNEDRTAINKKHGQDYDGKNIMHTVRLIMTAQEIPTEKKVNVDRTKNRDFLLDIKNGNINLAEVLEEWGNKAGDELKKLYDNSDLPNSYPIEEASKLELKIRNL